MSFRVAAITAGVFVYIFANGPAAASSWLPSWLGEAFNPPSHVTTSVEEEERSKTLRAAINDTAKLKRKRTRDAKMRKRAKWAARSRTAARETRAKREQSSKANGVARAKQSRSADRSVAAPPAVIVKPTPETAVPASPVSDVNNQTEPASTRISDVSNQAELASSRLANVRVESAWNVNELDVDTMQTVRALTPSAVSGTVGQKEASPEASPQPKPQASWWSRIWVAVLGSAAGSARWYKIAEEVTACRSRDLIERLMTIGGSDEKAEKDRADLLRRPLLLGDCHVLPPGMQVTFNEDRLSGNPVCIRTKILTECFWTSTRAIEQQRQVASR
jgi:hypothetical protein